MFKTKKATASSERMLAARVAELEAQHQALVAEKRFWQDQVVAYGNAVEFWQAKHRELLAQIAKESASIDLRSYAQSIEQAIIAARPDPSLIAGVLAMAGKDTQGAISASPAARALLVPRDVGGDGAVLRVTSEGVT